MASQLTVMDIYAEHGDTLYLKMQSFGTFTGQGWSEAQAFTETYGGELYANYIPYLLMSEVTAFQGYPLTITPKMDVRVIPYYIADAVSRDQFQPSDVEATGATDQPYTLYYRPYGSHTLPQWASSSAKKYVQAYNEFVAKSYLYVDDTTMAYMKLIIEEQGFDPADPDIVQKVAAYIQNAATYNLAYNQNLDREPNVALAFLGAYKEGVCRHYATAATLLYRALGIPARYTVGFLSDVTAGGRPPPSRAWMPTRGWRSTRRTSAGCPWRSRARLRAVPRAVIPPTLPKQAQARAQERAQARAAVPSPPWSPTPIPLPGATSWQAPRAR